MRDEEDVMSAITEQGMSRRNFLAGMAGVAGLAAAGLAGCSPAGGSKEASGSAASGLPDFNCETIHQCVHPLCL